MPDDDKPLSRPFEALKDLKSRLPKTRKPPEPEPAAPAPESEPEEPELPPDEAFDQHVEGWGVQPLAKDRERVERRPRRPAPAAQPPVRSRPRVARGVRGPEDGFDESTPRIDLHGLTVDHALAELQRHLAQWRARGVVRARIVTGRGAHSGDGLAAIREAVEDRLVATPGVLGVYRGTPAAGGEGVVLLELRGPGKRRSSRS